MPIMTEEMLNVNSLIVLYIWKMNGDYLTVQLLIHKLGVLTIINMLIVQIVADLVIKSMPMLTLCSTTPILMVMVKSMPMMVLLTSNNY
jgi:hypothetical protein